MRYLICDKCGGYYELQPSESPEDFDENCECGGVLYCSDSVLSNGKKDKISNNFNRWIKSTVFWLIIWGVLNLFWAPIGGVVLLGFGILIYFSKNSMVVTLFGAIWLLLALSQFYLGLQVNSLYIIFAVINGFSSIYILYRINRFEKINGNRILLFTAILLICVFIIFGLITNNLTNNLNHVTPSLSNGVSGVQVVVNYTGEWKGSITTNNKVLNLQENGAQTFNLNKTSFVKCYFQKTDGSSNTLKATILHNGQVVQTNKNFLHQNNTEVWANFL